MVNPYEILKRLEKCHGTVANVNDHGQVDVQINQAHAADLLVQLKHTLAVKSAQARHIGAPHIRQRDIKPTQLKETPCNLNIVIQIVGSRGDVQPFIALGKTLKEKYGHRIRLATHATFKSLVEDNGLEFFSIGGDPSELMAYMVKNPGLMPGMASVKAGDIGRHRKTMYEILKGCWRSCIETGNGMDDELLQKKSADEQELIGSKQSAHSNAVPFIADAIVANPPSFAHIHLAERTGIPLHIFFTMPWTPTKAFPHPIANINSNSQDASVKNYLTYGLVDLLTWEGLGDVVNEFRVKYLHLSKLDLSTAPGLENRLKIPHTYCWSPALIPKPADWGPEIDICGFFFLPHATDYKPKEDLRKFLAEGPPPVYIGFGSIVVKDPKAFTKLIFDAIKLAGVRALVSQGWSKFGDGEVEVPKDVLLLGDTPHDWLFKQVTAVVHHGGAGTTAAGLMAARPTVIIPFFGDQPFWGSMVARAGAGPQPIPFKQLTAEKLANAIKQALEPEVLKKAEIMASKMRQENGVETGAKSFQTRLQAATMHCDLLPDQHAIWTLRQNAVKLSALAVAILLKAGSIREKELRIYHPLIYDTEERSWGLPFVNFGAAVTETLAGILGGITDYGVLVKHGYERGRSAKEHRDKEANISGPNRNLHVERISTDVGVLNPSMTTADTDSERTAVAQSHSTHCAIHHMPIHLRHPGLSSENMDHPASAVHLSNSSLGSVVLEHTLGSGWGIGGVLGSIIKFPALLTLGTSQGFHRMPVLFGDTTVRPLPHVTGFKSGIRAACSVSALSLMDAVTGLVTLPYLGGKGRSGAGVAEGVLKGTMQAGVGIISKPLEAVFALPGYPLDGVGKEIQKYLGKSVITFVKKIRLDQGKKELAELGQGDAISKKVILEWERFLKGGRRSA